MWPGRRRKPKHSSDHAVIENVLRCCLHISNAFCGLAACDCADRAVPSSSSCWQQSRRTFADWPGSLPDLHRWPSRLWRKHQVTLGCVQALVQLLRSHRSQRSEWKPKPRFDAEAALAFSHLPLLQQRAASSEAHSITKSARRRTEVGIVMPIDFAVLRFTTSSKFVGNSTGRFAGLLPCSTLAARAPKRR